MIGFMVGVLGMCVLGVAILGIIVSIHSFIYNAQESEEL